MRALCASACVGITLAIGGCATVAAPPMSSAGAVLPGVFGLIVNGASQERIVICAGEPQAVMLAEGLPSQAESSLAELTDALNLLGLDAPVSDNTDVVVTLAVLAVDARFGQADDTGGRHYDTGIAATTFVEASVSARLLVDRYGTDAGPQLSATLVGHGSSGTRGGTCIDTVAILKSAASAAVVDLVNQVSDRLRSVRSIGRPREMRDSAR